ncbi:MAG: RND family transporter [Deltaproteobacteria bacterium]|nr:RND family transporter [Deltaproteobacteria bacterium]
MNLGQDQIDNMPVIHDLKDFDTRSGNLLERLVFNNRLAMICICVLITLGLAWQAQKIVVNASFDRMIPQNHPYIKNYMDNKDNLRGLGNSIRVVVENNRGDIFEPAYLETLKQINDEIFLTTGVDRAWMKSLWTPAVRWKELTEEGFIGGPVMPDGFSGSQESINQLKQNIGRAGIIGTLLSNDLKSSMIVVPLLEVDPNTGKRLNYHDFSQRLEKNIRTNYEQGGHFRVHIIGFAKIVGDLIDGLMRVMIYFVIAVLVVIAIIFFYTRCIRSAILVVACSVVAVLWQLGIVATIGFELDPYSILVPFLVFAIGVSHGAQKMNGIMQDIGRGTHKLVAARYTFRRLFLAGLTALLADAVGFAVLMLIDIPVIKQLALSASIGVAILIFTNLLLLPVLLSFVGVSPVAAMRSLKLEEAESTGKETGKVWAFLSRCTEKRWATILVAGAAALAVFGFIVSLNLKIGDLDPGAPELRADSRYNRDNAYITKNYSLSSDQFAIIVKTPPDGVMDYKTLIESDRLAWALINTPGVQTANSLANAIRQISSGSYEGNPKWLTVSRNQKELNYSGNMAVTFNPEYINGEGSVTPIVAFLSDHKAETLDRVVKVAEDFSKKHSDGEKQFLLAAGNSGIDAATNIVVRHASRVMMLYVYAAVILLCFITFRNWRAVIVAVLPLVLTSILCEALMVALGIGVKVATLPVIALGVGIGVDYALYLMSVQLSHLKSGLPLREAYMRAVRFTGKVVALVGITLAVAVITWVFSPIKFQADMGILLTFMFLWNMVGALVLIPALSHFMLRRVKIKDAVSTEEVLEAVSHP